MPKPGKLRIITYMCPSHPVEMYELLMNYLEEELNVEATLVYETRAGGPLPGRCDPFTDDSIDLAFMSSTAYLELVDSKNQFCELLPVAAVFKHPKNLDLQPGYYSDIIIHIDGKKYVKTFLDLRGCQWAYCDEKSLSGSAIVLKCLRELGENAKFFGNTIKSGNHLNSIQMVLQKQAEASAVDSTCLAYYRKSLLPKTAEDIFVLDSLGILPPYPIVVNSRLSDDMKRKMAEALMKSTQTRLWGERLGKFGIIKFAPNNIDCYNSHREIDEVVKDTGLGIRYY